MSNEQLSQAHNDASVKVSTEVTVLQLMDKYNFHLKTLKASLTEKGKNVSFSNLTFPEIAPFVGLDPREELGDATFFDLHRSRIPTSLFRAILEDMNIMLIQYGNMQRQTTEEARSRFIAPIFNHLVAQFGGSIRNTSESLLNGPITKTGRLEYRFEVFGAMSAVVVVEAKLELGTTPERMDAIAQVIAECMVCEFDNRQANVDILIYGIFCDGTSFQFFSFDGNPEPYKFSIGLIPGTHFRVGVGYALDDFSVGPASSFIHSLRPICEIVFNLFLLAYIASLKAYRDTFAKQKNLDGWEKALKLAEEVLEKSLDAEALRQKNLIADADATTEAAFQVLKLCTDMVPIADRYRIDRTLMKGWDDEVSKA